MPSSVPTLSSAQARAVLAITGAALFMIVLDNLIVVSTLPAIQRDLHVPFSSLEWVVNAYILSFAVLMLTGAALGERFGRRRVFVAGLLVFSGASAAGALAPTLGVLVAARAIQGIGGAVLMPLTLTLLTAEFPPERRGAALGLWSAISGVGVALGPIAGGLLTAGLSWHWIFWVNVPVGLAAAAFAPRVLHESRGEREPIDFGGMALASAGLFAIVWATVRGNSAGWGAPVTLGAYAAGASLLVAFIAWESRSSHPMLPLRLFESSAFSLANACGFLFQFAMFAAFLILVQFLADARHAGTIATGVDTLPWTVMPLLVSAPSGRLGQRIGTQPLMISGLALVTGGIAGIALTLTPTTGALALAPWMVTIGAGIGLFIPNLAALTMRSVAPADIGRASASLNTARQLGAVFGVAVAVAVFELAGSAVSPSAARNGTVAALLIAVAAAALGLALAVGAVWRARAAERVVAPAPAANSNGSGALPADVRVVPVPADPVSIPAPAGSVTAIPRSVPALAALAVAPPRTGPPPAPTTTGSQTVRVRTVAALVPARSNGLAAAATGSGSAPAPEPKGLHAGAGVGGPAPAPRRLRPHGPRRPSRESACPDGASGKSASRPARSLSG